MELDLLNRSYPAMARAKLGDVLQELIDKRNALLEKLDADVLVNGANYAETLWAITDNPHIPADTAAPTLTSATIGTDGKTLTLVFDETTLTSASGDYEGFVLNVDEDTSALSAPVRTNGTLVFTCVEVASGAVCTLDYTGADIKDMAGNALDAITGAAVTNHSAVE